MHVLNLNLKCVCKYSQWFKFVDEMFYFQIYSFSMKCWKPSNYMRELDYSVSVTVGLLTLEKIINVVGGGQEVGAQENKYLASFRGKLGTTNHIVVGDERIKSRAWEGRKTFRVWRHNSHSLGGGRLGTSTSWSSSTTTWLRTSRGVWRKWPVLSLKKICFICMLGMLGFHSNIIILRLSYLKGFNLQLKILDFLQFNIIFFQSKFMNNQQFSPFSVKIKLTM